MNTLLKMMTGQMLSCKQVDAFLCDYLEERLDPKVAAKFEDHISMCANCQSYIDQYRTTVTIAKSDVAEPHPPELVEKTLKFLKENL